MLQFIFSHLWIAIAVILFVLGEFACWHDAIDKYKRRDDPEDVGALIVVHAVVIGIVSFIYWITSLPVAE